jgi:hypothetical protein
MGWFLRLSPRAVRQCYCHIFCEESIPTELLIMGSSSTIVFGQTQIRWFESSHDSRSRTLMGLNVVEGAAKSRTPHVAQLVD